MTNTLALSTSVQYSFYTGNHTMTTKLTEVCDPAKTNFQHIPRHETTFFLACVQLQQIIICSPSCLCLQHKHDFN